MSERFWPGPAGTANPNAVTCGQPLATPAARVTVAMVMVEAGEYRLTAADGTSGNVRYIGHRARHGHQWRLRSPALDGTPRQDIRLGSRRAAVDYFADVCRHDAGEEAA